MSSSTTRRVIAASFKKLLGARPLDKITVKDIVEDAQVNRQTFYYHFCDIYALIRWILDGEAQAALPAYGEPARWHDCLQKLTDSMISERPLVMNAVHSLSREHLERYLFSVLEPIIRGQLEAHPGSALVSEQDKQFIIDFYKFACSGLFLDWVQRGMREESQPLVDRLVYMLEHDLTRCLEGFSARQ